jgi:hypothetical protein
MNRGEGGNKTVLRVALTVICLMLAVDAQAQFYEILTHEGVDRTFVVSGYFSNPGRIKAGQMILSVERRSPGGESREQYFFVGQTGEKSLEMSRTYDGAAISGHANIRRGNPMEEKIIVDLSGGESHPLPLSRLSLPSCTPVDRIVLKVISLKDGQLEYRVMLPDCFREAIRK